MIRNIINAVLERTINLICSTAFEQFICWFQVFLSQNPWIAVFLVGILLLCAVCFRNIQTWNNLAAFVTGKTRNEVDNEINLLITKAATACKDSGKTMLIVCDPAAGITGFTMSTGPKACKTIVMSPSWIAFLSGATPEDELIWEVAFLHSVGHELGHQFEKPSVFGVPVRRTAEERKLFCWLREVDCDLYGIRFIKKHFSHYSEEAVLNAVDVKIARYTAENGDVEGVRHPTWAVRRDIMANNTDINAEIIEMLVRESKCKNQDFIDAMYKLYGVEKDQE
jgi:hypothetical protein